MEHQVIIHRKYKTYTHTVHEGVNLLHLLREHNLEMHTPCNGKGTCGKCRVRVAGSIETETSDTERNVLGEKALADGYRLSCMLAVKGDLEVTLDDVSYYNKILTEGRQKQTKAAPAMKKTYVELKPASLEDQRPDSLRLAQDAGLSFEPDSLRLIRQLPGTLRQASHKVTLVQYNGQLVDVEAGDTTEFLCGIAVDIGTTTIAAYLLDLNTGERLGTYSCMNPQKKYGADVISRILHTMEDPKGLEEMHSLIISCINAAIDALMVQTGLSYENIYQLVFVGNTTMMHFLLNLPAQHIALAPFIPTTVQAYSVNAGELGIKASTGAVALAVPSVGAYIGADTVAAVLASGMDRKKEISLLIDLGTNGELVLGNDQWLFSCSAAAGPAFEGANIRYGVGGIKGAIDSCSIDETYRYTTIEEAKAVGICGSGLVDIVSELYKTGIIDRTGRLQKAATLPEGIGLDLINRIKEADGMNVFVAAYGSVSATGTDILVTQKDIRELQNAKAAIAAGIKILIERAGISYDDIKKVYLAGGFGTYINPESALNITLIPSELKGRIESIGNAAGIGAMEILISKKEFKRAQKISKRLKYIELSSCGELSKYFIESMMFGSAGK